MEVLYSLPLWINYGDLVPFSCKNGALAFLQHCLTDWGGFILQHNYGFYFTFPHSSEKLLGAQRSTCSQIVLGKPGLETRLVAFKEKHVQPVSLPRFPDGWEQRWLRAWWSVWSVGQNHIKPPQTGARGSPTCPQSGPEIPNSLSDLCIICMTRGSPKLPQAGPKVTDSPGEHSLLCVTERTPDPPPGS